MINNPFRHSPPGLTGAVRNMIPVDITTVDHNLGDSAAIGILVVVGGVLNFTDVDGNTVTITVPNNFTVQCSVSSVQRTATTAASMYLLMA